MADIDKIISKLTIANPKFKEQSARKAEVEKDYEFVAKFQGITEEFDDVLNKIKKGIDDWNVNEYVIGVSYSDEVAIKLKLRKIFNVLEDETNFQID